MASAGVAYARPAVRLLQSNGGSRSGRGNPATGCAGCQGLATPFLALELPDSLVLRRGMTVPAMSDAQTLEAVALDVQTANPFGADDLVWGLASALCRRAGTGGDRTAFASTTRQLPEVPERPLEKRCIARTVGAGSRQPAHCAGRFLARYPPAAYHGKAAHGVWPASAGTAGAGGHRDHPHFQLRARAIEAVNAYTDLPQPRPWRGSAKRWSKPRIA